MSASSSASVSKAANAISPASFGTARINAMFAALQATQRKALIPFIMSGDPLLAATVPIMHALAASGADLIELGVPFSDPMADGPVIQLAGERALAKQVGLGQVLAMVKDFRATNHSTPVVLMGYANPVERYDQRLGTGSFVRDAKAAGVDGVLVVDYPPESCQDFADGLKSAGLAPIFLLAPTSSEARMKSAGKVGQGYVYYVSLKGVTGSASLDTAAVEAMLPRIRAQLSLPVGVGFGIRDAATARAVGKAADAVVIGSKLVQLLFDAQQAAASSGNSNHASEAAQVQAAVDAARGFMAEIRAALDA